MNEQDLRAQVAALVAENANLRTDLEYMTKIAHEYDADVVSLRAEVAAIRERARTAGFVLDVAPSPQ